MTLEVKIIDQTAEKTQSKEKNIKTISDSSKLSKSSLLIFLYFLQGLVIGIVLETMPMNLKKNFHYKEIGFFLMCSYPFSLKILWSFIIDTYYFKKFGLRKTWIILTQSISSLIFFYMSFNIEQIILEKKILFLSVMCFVLIFCIATQDIAVDGWALSLFGNDSGSMASSCQAAGQILGISVSTSIYINLHHYNLISLEKYLLLICSIFIFGTFILFFIKEKEESHLDESESHSIITTLNRIKKMTKNRNLRRFLAILLFTNIGNIFYNNILNLVLIEKGITQELLTNIGTLLIPIEIYFTFRLSKTTSKFLQTYFFGYKNLIFIYIIQLLFVNFYNLIAALDNKLFNMPTILILFFLSLVRTILCLNCHNGLGGFFHKISDNKIGATYITALYSFMNLSHKWPGVIIYTFVDYFGHNVVGLFSIIYCACFYMYFKKSFEELDNLHSSEWKIKEIVELEEKSN